MTTPFTSDFRFRAAIGLEIPGFARQVRRFGLRGQLTQTELGVLSGIARIVAPTRKPSGSRAAKRAEPGDDFPSIFDSGRQFLLIAR